MKVRHFPKSLVDLSLKFGIDLRLVSLLQSNSISPLNALRDHLARLPTPTAAQSTIRTLIRLLLLYTAHATSSSHLLLGTTLTGLSIKLISGVATGGGFVVREEAEEEWAPGFKAGDDRNHTVKVIRPLKDMGVKECAAWIWWNELEVVPRAPGTAAKQDIGELTKGNAFFRCCILMLMLRCRRLYRWSRERLSIYGFYNLTHVCKVGPQRWCNRTMCYVRKVDLNSYHQLNI